MSVLVLALLGVATNVATGVLPAEWTRYRWIAWPASGALVLILITLGLAERRGEVKPVYSQPNRARHILIDRVRRYWIQGVLERSLYYKARLELKLTVTIQSRGYPWDIAAFQPDGTAIEFPPDADVNTMFEALDRTIVILGDPGSGKTTMLLELARCLLEEAEQDESNPIPVVLPLSSWVIGRKSISEWITDQLKIQYGIPSQLASDWVGNQSIIPLFDGLDEVSEEHRNYCVRLINEYLHKNSLTSSALCCRRTEYNLLRERLGFYGVLTIQPLTRQQVESYVDGSGPGLRGLQVALAADPGLWELAQSPLLLSIMALAYPPQQDMTEVRTLPDTRHNLYAYYVRAMLRRRPHHLYTPRQSAKYLSTLARGLQQDDQTVFTFDLLSDRWRGISHKSSSIQAKAIASLTAGVILFLAAWGLLGLKAGLAAGIFSVIFIRLALSIDNYRDFSEISGYAQKNERQLHRVGTKSKSDWVFSSLLGAIAEFPDSSWQMTGMLVAIACLGIVISVLQTAAIAIAYTVVLALVAIIAYGIADHALIEGYFYATINSNRREIPSPLLRLRLNLGSWAAITTGFVCGAIAAFAVWAPSSALPRARFGVVAGLFSAVLVLVLVAGAPIIEQVLTRWKLMREGAAPLPCLPFLDYMVQCLLLQSVGPGYIFVHRELQEFMANKRQDWDALVGNEKSRITGNPLL